jgi:glutamate formiminotransferase
MILYTGDVRRSTMQSNLDKLEHNRVLLELEADPKEVADAFNQAYKKVVKQINVPGFRKGKTPRLETIWQRGSIPGCYGNINLTRLL